MAPSRFFKKMRSGIAGMGLDLSDTQLERFDEFKNELVKWSKIHNLTKLLKDDDILNLHFLDSLAYLPAIPADSQRIADVGSGAGFPGIPLAITKQDCDFVLYERSIKKMAFLKNVVRLLGLTNVQVKKTVNETGSTPDRCFDCVVSRALWRPSQLYENVKSVLCKNGVIIVSEGRSYESYLIDIPSNIDKKIIRSNIPDGVDRWLIVLISGQ